MLAYLFPGQGSQQRGMGEALFEEFPELTERASNVLGYSIKALCLQDADRNLNNTQFTQPAIYVVNALSYLHKISSTGKKPDFLAGHSLGEYNALQAAGAISFEDGLMLVKKRGELMSKANNGVMAAILGMTSENVQKCLEDNNLACIDIANYNSPSQTVISGLKDDLVMAQTHFENAGAMVIPLNTSGAFHSRYMAPARDEFRGYIGDFSFSAFDIPVISNVHATAYTSAVVLQNLVDQITHPVRWTDSILYLLREGVSEFEELGVGDVLKKLNKYIRDWYEEERRSSSKTSSEHNKVFTSNTPKAQQPTLRDTRTIDDLTKEIDVWNNRYPIGTKVRVRGITEELETRTKAVMLFGQRAAIYLGGYSGYFSLDDVSPAGKES